MLAAFFVSLAASAQPQPPPGWGTLSWYKRNTETVLNSARAMFEPLPSASEQAIAQAIVYRVTAQNGVGAFAFLEDGRRKVQISAGFTQMIEYLAEAMIFDAELGLDGCFDEYSQRLGETFIDNTRRHRNGLPPRGVPNLLAYAQSTEGRCSAIDPRDFTSRPDLGEYRAKMIEASIVFLYLHELGHHVLGHVQESAAETPVAMRRDQEDTADRWAITTALKQDYNLVAATPVFAFIALTGGNSIESERSMTHPLGIRRVLTLYDEVENHYRNAPSSWNEPPPLEEFLGDMTAQRGRLENLIGALD